MLRAPFHDKPSCPHLLDHVPVSLLSALVKICNLLVHKLQRIGRKTHRIDPPLSSSSHSRSNPLIPLPREPHDLSIRTKGAWDLRISRLCSRMAHIDRRASIERRFDIRGNEQVRGGERREREGCAAMIENSRFRLWVHKCFGYVVVHRLWFGGSRGG